ncbi:MAG: hypothetical protein ACU0BB_02590 [Paracoccaceae bacterium]
MLRIACISVMCLAACNGPSPHFANAPVTRIAVEGSTFDVRVQGNLAEAIRVNPEYAPRFGPIRKRAGVAMAQASGCEVVDVLGDQSISTGVLACNGTDHAEWLIRTAVATAGYDCIESNDWAWEKSSQDYTDYECFPR